VLFVAIAVADALVLEVGRWKVGACVVEGRSLVLAAGRANVGGVWKRGVCVNCWY